MKKKLILVITIIFLLATICTTAIACKNDKTFTVKFKTNGATAIADITVKSNSTLKLPDDPKIENYNFMGWFLDSKLTEPFSLKSKIKSDITLYAKWEIAEHEHIFGNKYIENGFEKQKCKICGFVLEEKLLVGLSYTLKNDGTYSITAVGILENKNVIIPSIYEGKSVTSIGKMSFNHSDLQSVTIPNTINVIEDSAFSNCKALTSVTFEKNAALTTFGENVFYNCSALTTINIDVITKINALPKGTFNGCSSLLTFNLPTNITTIGNNAFMNCTKLTTANLSSNIISLGTGVFSGCKTLTEVSLPENLTIISSSLFENCSELTYLAIPKSITTIGTFAFSNCKKLTALVLPCNNLTILGASAFENCIGLTQFIIPKTVTTIGTNTFKGCSSMTKIYFLATNLPSNLGSNWNGGIEYELASASQYLY